MGSFLLQHATALLSHGTVAAVSAGAAWYVQRRYLAAWRARAMVAEATAARFGARVQSAVDHLI